MSEVLVYSKRTTKRHQDILKLSGIFGIHSIHGTDPFHYLISEQDKDFTIEIKSDVLKILFVTISTETKIITINKIVKNDVRKSVAYYCLKSLIDFAKKDNYRQLELMAWRKDSDDDIFWTGYFIWGKYGFLMKSKSDQEYVELLISRYKIKNLKKNTLYYFISKKEGLDLWIQYGQTWLAVFYLENNSESIQIFNLRSSSGLRGAFWRREL